MLRAWLPALLCVAFALAPVDVRAQCQPEWTEPIPDEDFNGIIYASVVFDGDLYVAGNFTHIGDLEVNRVARWDGSQWHAIGAGLSNTVFDLAVFDDGSGETLYAGGSFVASGLISVKRVAQLNAQGTGWFSVGGGMPSDVVHALEVYDDGTGPALYAGGTFLYAGQTAANRIAKWDGVSWSPLGNGILDGFVQALTIFDDDGAGPNPPALYAGGGFTNADGVSAPRIAKWDGTSWGALNGGPSQNGVNGSVYSLTTWNGNLYLGGYFTEAGGSGSFVTLSRVAMWDGNTWSAVGGGVGGAVLALGTFDPDGSGSTPSQLIAGGAFTSAGGTAANYIASFNGSSWSPLGVGRPDVIRALAVYDDTGGAAPPALFAGGEFRPQPGVTWGELGRWGCAPLEPPTITTHPQDETACVGDSVTFTCEATGSEPLQYQWYFNGFPQAGANSTTFTVDPVELADAGAYFCRVTNTAGQASSATAVLTVEQCFTIGDTNCDGLVNAGDIDPFITAITDEAAYAAEYPNCDISSADCNEDGLLNAGDIDPFIAILTAP